MITGSGSENSDGNGALMRNVPSGLASNVEECIRIAHRQSLTTHRGINQSVCCALHAYLLYCLIHGENLDERGFPDLQKFSDVYQQAIQDKNFPIKGKMISVLNSTEEYNWKDKNWDLPENKMGGYVGSYAVDCIALALHYLYYADNTDPASVLEKMACVGGDADSNCAVLGPLLGAKFGLKALRNNWVKAIFNFDDYDFLLQRFLLLLSVFNGTRYQLFIPPAMQRLIVKENYSLQNMQSICLCENDIKARALEI